MLIFCKFRVENTLLVSLMFFSKFVSSKEVAFDAHWIPDASWIIDISRRETLNFLVVLKLCPEPVRYGKTRTGDAWFGVIHDPWKELVFLGFPVQVTLAKQRASTRGCMWFVLKMRVMVPCLSNLELWSSFPVTSNSSTKSLVYDNHSYQCPNETATNSDINVKFLFVHTQFTPPLTRKCS